MEGFVVLGKSNKLVHQWPRALVVKVLLRRRNNASAEPNFISLIHFEKFIRRVAVDDLNE